MRLTNGPGLAGHEVAEVVDDRPVLLGADLADARGGALADVAEQARPADLRGPLEHPVAARAHGEDAQQDVDGLADRPRVAVRAEVARALALGAAPDHDPRELVADGDREPGVGLVVAVLHVETRVELLDPGVLELERLDLGVDDGPLDPGRGGDHRRRALVQVGDVLEVGGEPRAQVVGLADVDHPVAGVAEPVDARLGRDRARLGPVRQRPAGRARGSGGRHGSTLRRAADSAHGVSDSVVYCRVNYSTSMTSSRPLRPGALDQRRGGGRLRPRPRRRPVPAAGCRAGVRDLDRARPHLRAWGTPPSPSSVTTSACRSTSPPACATPRSTPRGRPPASAAT